MANETKTGLTEVSDECLAALALQGKPEAFTELAVRYMPLVRAKASFFRAGGAEKEDLYQEGLLGLMRAAQTFQPGKSASFRTYAGVCIANSIRMAYRTAAAKKNDPLNSFVSLSEENSPQFEASCSASPEALIDSRESFHQMCCSIAEMLTPMELRVLRLYLSGCSYREIAEKMSVTQKAADNALQRIRSKLKQSGGNFH